MLGGKLYLANRLPRPVQKLVQPSLDARVGTTEMDGQKMRGRLHFPSSAADQRCTRNVSNEPIQIRDARGALSLQRKGDEQQDGGPEEKDVAGHPKDIRVSDVGRAEPDGLGNDEAKLLHLVGQPLD